MCSSILIREMEINIQDRIVYIYTCMYIILMLKRESFPEIDDNPSMKIITRICQCLPRNSVPTFEDVSLLSEIKETLHLSYSPCSLHAHIHKNTVNETRKYIYIYVHTWRLVNFRSIILSPRETHRAKTYCENA